MISRPALLLLALAAPAFAWGQAVDVPQRVARLSYVEGEVVFQGAADASPAALPDRPLMPGDRLSTGADGRAEFAFGTAVLRLDQDSALSFVSLDEAAVRAQLTAGTSSLHLRELLDDETFEIVTPSATIAFREPGEFRVDVAADHTDLTARAGAAEIATAAGPIRVTGGQRVRLEAGAMIAGLAAPQPADAFDDWVLEREVQFAQAEPSAAAPSNDYYADETLDRYGEWREEPSYGRVWVPSYAYGGYDPFRYGQWQRSGFGWSWYDPMPWSAYTFHHGRWAYLRHANRWCWVPARRDHRRHVAQDTRPYRQPRDANPRRIDPDRRPTLGRVAETGKPARRPTLVPSTNRDPSPPAQSQPAPRQSAPASKDVASKLLPAQARSRAQTKSQSQSAPLAGKGIFAPQQIP